ncbi:uncharacterized protein IL334_003778 [Kwoniella shivajii]|uniref:Major facilitator superfamily (MFS) profile domain-containing protein n=1 Tax=Kwoniella shivajii TaxID=564305 RepID=A0ABZ1D077_9TREE|nr:hypothetical protein IL334_003778 [Kwoniella shivajii]
MEAYFQYRSFTPPAKPIHEPIHEQQLEEPKRQIIYLDFDENDKKNPKNWSGWYKAFVIGQLTFLTLSLTFASSVSASSENGVMEEFGCSNVAATASTGIFLVGMGLGAMPQAPLSELHGRLPVYLITILLATIFEIASALAPNIAGLLILRFIAGFFSSAPLSNAGGTLNDIGDPLLRTVAFPSFATAGFAGPILGPIIGGYVSTNPNYGWRWCYWICAIWQGIAFIMCSFFMPETLAPALIKYKAIQYRKTTGEGIWRAPIEDESIHKLTVKYLQRPFVLISKEPILQLFVAYLTIVYIVLYGFFSAYPIIFLKHGFTERNVGLSFIPVMVGFFVLMVGNLVHYLRYKKLVFDAKAGITRRGIYDGKVEPEERLVPLMASAVCFPASIFWLAWTSGQEFNVWIPMMSGLLFGIGLLAIFQGSMQYLIDAYGPYAASALAGCTLVRYSIPGLVTLAFPKAYETLGDQWATSLFGFLGLALTPVPFIFYIYGRRVRDSCEYTVRD